MASTLRYLMSRVSECVTGTYIKMDDIKMDDIKIDDGQGSR